MVKRFGLTRILVCGFLVVTLTTTSGCLGSLAQLLHVIRGHQTPAAYSGLEEQKVAVVCVSDASAYGPDTLTTTINKVVGMKLATNGKEIDVIPASNVQDWVDRNGWDESDFIEIGKGLGADKVLGIEIGNYSIHEGSTIYKGRVDLTATVFDVATGKVTYVHGPELFEFPKHGRPAIQTTDRQFEAVFLAKLTQHLSRQFFKHDHLDTVAEDASLMR